MRLPSGYGSVINLGKNRRKPFAVRITIGWDDNGTQKYKYISYHEKRQDALTALADYNKNPYNVDAAKITFKEVFERWSKDKYPTISDSGRNSYNAAYNACDRLYDKQFNSLKLADLQFIVDTCNKNFPTLRKLKGLYNQLYKYAMKYEICNKDYSEHVDILKYKDRNPNKYDRSKFSDEEVAKLWTLSEDKFYKLILMMIYSGVRISEFLDLKKSDVHLEERYFNVIDSKTENGIRKVPIAEKVYSFWEYWYSTNGKYLVNNDGLHFLYRNYYDSYYRPILENIGIKKTPHCCRYTCVSMLATAGVDQTIIKKIVGHSGAMTLTEKVYTHFDVKILVDAINKI